MICAMSDNEHDEKPREAEDASDFPEPPRGTQADRESAEQREASQAPLQPTSRRTSIFRNPFGKHRT